MASWQTNKKAAYNQAILWSESAGANQDWPTSARDYAVDMIVECDEATEEVGDFWALLAACWEIAGREHPSLAQLDGWSSLQGTWDSAVQAASSSAERANAAKWSTQLVGTLTLSWEDVSDAADKIPNPAKWGGGLKVLALVVAIAYGASR